MAQKTQMVTISLDEYRELLLKDKPLSSNDSVLLERFMNELEKEIKYTDSTYYSGYVGNNMNVEKGEKVLAEFMKMLKYLDFERYMNVWNKVMTSHRKEEEEKEKIKQMNEAKRLRHEATDE